MNEQPATPTPTTAAEVSAQLNARIAASADAVNAALKTAEDHAAEVEAAHADAQAALAKLGTGALELPTAVNSALLSETQNVLGKIKDVLASFSLRVQASFEKLLNQEVTPEAHAAEVEAAHAEASNTVAVVAGVIKGEAGKPGGPA